LMIGYLAYL